MKNNHNRSTVIWTTAGLALALVAGCAHQQCSQCQQPIAHGEKFESQDRQNVMGFVDEQSAVGAKADAMLYDRHFDGNRLNSLGTAKLDAILKASPTDQPVVLYMNMPHDAVADRQAAVAAYLHSAGVKDSQIQIAEGSNPNETTPTAYNEGSIYKAVGPSYDGSAADAVAPGGAAAPSASH